MSEVVVYTAVLGRTDPLHLPLIRGPWPMVCFADRPMHAKGWELVRVPKSQTPTRAARALKAMSHKLFCAEWTLWLDAAFTLLVDPRQFVGLPWDAVVFLHRDRTRITDEAAEIVRLNKAPADRVFSQLAEYRANGFDADDNPQQVLSATGALLRRNTEKVRRFNEEWHREIERHTLRDQMSFDYCAERAGLRVGRWPGNHKRNPFFRYRHHNIPVNDV